MNWKDLGGKLAAIGLPLLGGAIGGPGGAMVGKGLAAALGLGAEATPEQTAAALGNLSGEQLVRIRELEADLAKEELKSGTQLALAQIEVNKAEVLQQGFFKGGWRPFAGWAAVSLALVYPAVRAIVPWCLKVAGVEGVPEMPALDATEALSVLGTLLGVAKFRSDERKAGKV